MRKWMRTRYLVPFLALLVLQSPQEPPGALPFELAFDRREFVWDSGPAASPDGRMVAYSVRQPPPDMNLDARYQPDGTPSSAIGSRIYVSEMAGGAARDVCPAEGSCWRPSWAPEGDRLAFYSNAGGFPQLWVYDFGARTARRIGDAPIKAKLWDGDQARWSPDGQTLYVPMAPTTNPPGSPTSPAGGAAASPPEQAAATSANPRAARPSLRVTRAGTPPGQMPSTRRTPREARASCPRHRTPRPSGRHTSEHLRTGWCR